MNLKPLVKQIEESYKQMSGLLLSVSEQQDWQLSPDTWSFRYLAGHMAVTDSECWQLRIHQLAAGQQPHFDTYLNTGRTFNEQSLRKWVTQWGGHRRQIIDFVQTLGPEQLTVAGTHDWFGEVTIPTLLVEMHRHDRGHIEEVQPMLTACLAPGSS